MLSGRTGAFNMVDNLPGQIFFEIHRQMAPVEDYMTNQISAHSPKLHKRNIITNMKAQLKSYIQRTYTNKGIASFQKTMKLEMNKGFAQYYQYTKRDTMLTQEQMKHRQLEFSKWLGKRIDAKFKNHMIREFDSWKKEHNPVHRIINKIKPRNRGQGNQKTGLQKRYVELNPKNSFIFEVVIAFLTIPFFANPFALGLWGVLFGLFLAQVLARGVLHRLVFGKWGSLF